MQRGFSYQVYATQAEGGIKEDGRVGIDMQGGDFTVSEIHSMIDKLMEAARAATGNGIIRSFETGTQRLERAGSCRFE
jgi:hypothetical protein